MYQEGVRNHANIYGKSMQNHQTSVKKSTRRGPMAHWGQKGPPEHQKAPNTYLDKSILEIIWEALGHFLEIIFDVFFLWHIFRSLGDFWTPKVPKRLPKWSPNGGKSMSGGNMGRWRLLEATFSRLRLQTLFLLEASWGAFLQMLDDFGYPLGLLGNPFWTQKTDFFTGSDF